MEQVTQERIEELEGALSRAKAGLARSQRYVDEDARHVANVEAELARLRAANEQQGWQEKWVRGDGGDEWYSADGRKVKTPPDLVAHFKAEATKTMREQLEEAAALLENAFAPNWMSRMRNLVRAIRDSAGEGSK